MQILSAPTRKEIDKAHARKKWLDIGVPSVRNLKNVATKKVVMWCLLGLSSLPLHLLYNSLIFYSLATNEYDIIFATEGFVLGGPQSIYNQTMFPNIRSIQTQAKTWQRLDKVDCINAYCTEFLNTRRNLVAVVVDNTTAENEAVKQVVPYLLDGNTMDSRYNPYQWICDTDDGVSRYGYTRSEAGDDRHCSSKLPKIKANAERWRVLGRDIQYCLSEQVTGNCNLNFSLAILVVVIICNVSKALVMLFIAFRLSDKPLITVGDAIDSFLNDRDPMTHEMCLSSKVSIRADDVPQYCVHDGETYEQAYRRHQKTRGSFKWRAGPVEYTSSVKRWFRATSGARWWSCLSL